MELFARVPTDESRVAEIVRSARRIAVVGLSRKPERPSNSVAAYLQSAGYTIIPVHPLGGVTLGEPVHPDLRSAARAAGPIDIVNIFRRSEHVPALVDAILDVRPALVWMQQGIRSDEAARRLEAAGITVVMDRCLAVDHQFMRA
jgi:predicted CoA-binding protein